MTAALITLNSLSDDENRVMGALQSRLDRVGGSNRQKAAYYEGEQAVRMLGISIPPGLAKIHTVVGWPGTAVDVLEERLDWEGWSETEDEFGLGEVFRRNELSVDAGMAHLDALIYGTAFVTVGAGDGGPLVTVESAAGSTGLWDVRNRVLSSAMITRSDDDGQTMAARLYLPNETVYLERATTLGQWLVVDRDQHRLGRVPVAQLVNRPRAGRMGGRSEISQAVRGYTDAAVRTLLGMEINREFFSAPQRYVLGASEDAFVDQSGAPVPGWQTIMGRVLGLDRDEDGGLPQVGQFPQSTPGPYLEQIRGLAQLVSAETAIPATYLGFATDQAASADAIRAMDARLEKRALRRMATFGRGWLEVGRLALLIRDGVVPKEFNDVVSIKWRSPATPTPSASADAATKLIGAGVLTPESRVTLDRVGLTPQEQRQLESDRRRQGMSVVMSRLANVDASGADDLSGRRGNEEGVTGAP